MSRKEIKLHAKEIMKLRWGIILLAILLGVAGTAIAGTITIGIGSVLVIGPLLLGQYYILEDVRIGKAGDWKDILKGFKAGFAESLLARILLEIIVLIPVIIAVITMFIVAASSMVSMISYYSMGAAGYGGGSGAGAMIGSFFGFLIVIAAVLAAIYLKAAYAQTFYILMREPGISAVQAMKKSRNMMKGHIGEYILFVLSFIGWFLLGIVTFYIGFIWIIPYYEMSKMVFLADIYENSTGNFNAAFIKDSMDAAEPEQEPEPEAEPEAPEPAEETEPAYDTCISCGAKLPDGAKFCGKCGTPQ